MSSAKKKKSMKVGFDWVIIVLIIYYFQSSSLKAKLSSSVDLSVAHDSSDNGGDSNNESISATPNRRVSSGAVSAQDFDIAEESPRTSISNANGSFARSAGSIVNPDFSDVLLSVDVTENQTMDNLAKVSRFICCR